MAGFFGLKRKKTLDGGQGGEPRKPDRRGRILSGLADLAGLVGVEIGALDSPLVLKSQGLVYYVDYTNTAALKAKYANLPGHDAGKIVDVDAVWGANTLAQGLAALPGGRPAVDYVVASHVIEHVPDLLTWLAEIRAILKPGGTLHLAVPDRRYTFDIRRGESRMADVLNAYLLQARAPLPHQIIDFDINFMAVDVQQAWRGETVIPCHFDRARLDHALEVAGAVARTCEYVDIHCWVFTPLSFALLMEQLAALDLLHFACDRWFDTARDELEFVAILRESGDVAANTASWAAMAKLLAAS